MENEQNNESSKKENRIQVYLKVKQPLEKDKLYYKISEDKTLISLYDKVIKDDSSKTQKIEVDKIFDDSDNEQNMYQEICKNCINGCLEGNNFTYISYGDSTSEKNELIIGDDTSGKRGIYYLLLGDINNNFKQNPELSLGLSFLMVNGSYLIDLSLLKNISLENYSERDLINNFGKEININDTDIMKDIKKIPFENHEDISKFISNIFFSLKMMEDAENNRIISCSYFCFTIYIINKKNKKVISTISFIIIPGNELLTTKITNPNNAKRDNITNTKNVVELSYTIEDVVRHLSTQTSSEKNDTENMNKSKFMAVIGKLAFDVGNLDSQFDRRYRILGSIFANTGLYYNTKDTLYFLFRCKKITRQKFNLELALSLLEHDKRKSTKYRRILSTKENMMIKSKNEIEEKLKIKDDQIYELESKLKLHETKVAELNARLEKKDINLKNIRNNYKTQIECLKDSMGFKGDINILLSKDQYTKEYRYALNIRNTFKLNHQKAEIIFKLEEKIKELNKEKDRLKQLLENKTKEKKILRIINSKENYRTEEESEEMEENIYLKNKIIQDLKKKNKELEKKLELYNQENKAKINLIQNLPKVLELNMKKLKDTSQKIKEEKDKLKKNFIEEAKDINIKNEEERKKLIDKFENTLNQNKKERINQNILYNEFEQKYAKEKSKCIDELLRLHKNLMNITYGYKSSFSDLNPNIILQNKNSATTNATNLLYMQKDEFEKILENEVKLINKKQYPLLFKYLKEKGENIASIITPRLKENIGENVIMRSNSNNSEINEDKNFFKFFEGYEKKTENEIDNMNKNQLIQYSKKFLNRASDIENYLTKFIEYKQGYNLSQDEELKINEYKRKLEKAYENLEDMTEKYNSSKLFLQKNNQLIEQLNKENLSLKKKFNNIMLMEKLTNNNFNSTMKNKNMNKKNYKEHINGFDTHTTFYNNEDRKDINFNKEYGKTFTNLPTSQNIKNSFRCNTYNNCKNSQKERKIFFNNKSNRPFSSFQYIRNIAKK